MEPKIIILTHPSSEHKIDPIEKVLGFKTWNFKAHARKFIKNNGLYIDKDNNTFYDELAFWAEWEPESYFTKLVHLPDNMHSKYIHEPFYTNNPNRFYLQNTDPFIFNNDFHYCVCNQHKAKEFMKIPNGSILMFAGMVGLGEKDPIPASFAIDTLLVIKKSIIYSAKTLLECFKDYTNGNTSLKLYDVNGVDYLNISREYYEIVLDKIKHEFPGENLTLYECENYQTNKDLYSFFPCCKYGDSNNYKKTILPIEDRSLFPKMYHGNSKNEFLVDNKLVRYENKKSRINAQNYPCILVEGISINEFYNKVKEYIFNQNKFIGISADLPPFRNDINYWENIHELL